MTLAGLLVLALTAPLPPLASDVPEGTDLACRIALGELAPKTRAAWDELSPLLQAWPTSKGLVEGVSQRWRESWADVAEAAGLDLTKPGASASLLFDLDAVGGPVYVAVVRGAAHGEPSAAAIPLSFDEHAAFALPGRDVVWAKQGDAVILGNERGVRRQLAWKPSGTADALQKLAQRVRDNSVPFALVFVLSPQQRRDATPAFGPTAGALIASLGSGIVTAGPRGLDVSLTSDNKKDRELAEHALRAVIALVDGGLRLAEGGAELVVGLDGKKTPFPKELDTARLDKLLGGWLRDFHLKGDVRARPNNVTEAHVEVSDYRGFLAAGLILTALDARPAGVPPRRAEANLKPGALRPKP